MSSDISEKIGADPRLINFVDACRSAIISPGDKQVIIHDGKIELKGWAYSGGGNWVERVEVSPDG